MQKILGDEQERITVRLPRELYAALRTIGRQLHGRGGYGWRGPSIGHMIRLALRHYVDCPDRFKTLEAEDATHH